MLILTIEVTISRNIYIEYIDNLSFNGTWRRLATERPAGGCLDRRIIGEGEEGFGLLGDESGGWSVGFLSAAVRTCERPERRRTTTEKNPRRSIPLEPSAAPHSPAFAAATHGGLCRDGLIIAMESSRYSRKCLRPDRAEQFRVDPDPVCPRTLSGSGYKPDPDPDPILLRWMAYLDQRIVALEPYSIVYKTIKLK